MDLSLPDKLRAELPGILAWAVQGCLDWQEHGLGIPEEVRAATSEYRAEMDTLASFLDERCVLAKNAGVPSRDLYREYREWSEAAGERPDTETTFGRKLTERGLTREKRSGKRSWFGIGLRNTETQETLDTLDTLDTISGIFPHENILEKNLGEGVQRVQRVQPPETPSIASPDRSEPPLAAGDAPPSDEELLWQWVVSVQSGKERGYPADIDRAAHRIGFTFDRFAPVEGEAARLEAHLTQRTDGEAPRG